MARALPCCELLRRLQDAKVRLQALLLQPDSRYVGRAKWGPAHLRGLSEGVGPIPAHSGSKAPGPTAIPPRSADLYHCDSKNQPTSIQDIRWKAPVRLCKRWRRLGSRGPQAHGLPVAIALEVSGFIWALAQEGLSVASNDGGS